jgi:DNA-binding MarR family transcriptional regulator
MPDTKVEFLLRDLLKAVYWFDEGLQSHLEAAGWPRLSRTKSMMMINLANGLTRPIQLAASLGISRQAVQLSLADLEKDGLIRLEPDPNDRRAKRAVYTDDPRGIQMQNDALQALQNIEAELEKRVGAGAYRQLSKALRSDWGAPFTPVTDSGKS